MYCLNHVDYFRVMFYRGMIEELGAQFSSRSRVMSGADFSSNKGVSDEELVNPGVGHAAILRYLSPNLPQYTKYRLECSIQTIR